MYKNLIYYNNSMITLSVSILVLMDLCIKTLKKITKTEQINQVSILVLMDLCIKTAEVNIIDLLSAKFQSLF